MANLQLIIGNKNYSSWSLRPWIFMKMLNIEFVEKRVALFTETTDQELAGYNSNHKVPVLVDNGFSVWDTLAIMEYLSETYLNGAGWPADSKARAFARSISAEMHSSFMDLREAMPMNCRKHFANFIITPAVNVDIERITSLWRYCRAEYGTGGEWLFGEYSIADAMFAPVVLRFMSYDVDLGKVESIYSQSVLNSPAIVDWIESGKIEKEIIEIDEVDV